MHHHGEHQNEWEKLTNFKEPTWYFKEGEKAEFWGWKE